MKLEKTDKRALLMGAAGATAAFGILVTGAIVVRLTIMPHRAIGSEGIGRPGGGFGMMANKGGMHGMRPASGTVQSTNDKTIIIKDDDNNTTTITIDDNTKYSKDRADAKLSDIKTGDTIAVFGKLTDNKVTAKHVMINPDFL